MIRSEIRTAGSLADAINTRSLIVCDRRFAEQLPQEAFAVPGGEDCKDMTTVARLWQWLEDRGATRSSVLTIVGGGSVTDMAGFAAACFKRGMPTAYVPTTILAAVDAAIGGKTGVNFSGLKNEIGAFHMPGSVTMVPSLWRTLSFEQIISGYGEVLKTALLMGENEALQSISLGQRLPEGAEIDADMVAGCAAFKQRIVEQDPYDHDVRRQLNLGHTFAHAFESLMRARGKQLNHGHAVATGLVCMAALSHMRLGLQADWVEKIAATVRGLYEPVLWRCSDFEALYSFMQRDKKNSRADAVSVVLLSAPGRVELNCSATADDLRAALDIAADYLH